MRFIRWAGSKVRNLPLYQPHFPTSISGRFIEPMCGAATLAFEWEKRWQGGICIVDANTDLMAVYNWLRHAGEEVIKHLEELADYYKLRGSEEDRRDLYDEVVQIYNQKEDGQRIQSPREAAYFIFLNRTSFNGLYRVNAKGKYNTPFGKLDHLPHKLSESVREAMKVLQRPDMQLYLHDYQWVLSVAKLGDVVYFDPPFEGTFTSYTKDNFKGSEQERLRDTALELTNQGVTVYIASSDTPAIRELYEEFGIVELKSRRSISCNGDGREHASELLMFNGVAC